MDDIVLLDYIAIVPDQEELTFEIKGGVFDGIRYTTKVELDEETQKYKSTWEFVDIDNFGKACYTLMNNIIQDDFTAKVNEMMQRDAEITNKLDDNDITKNSQ